jgi:hypothetical protein
MAPIPPARMPRDTDIPIAYGTLVSDASAPVEDTAGQRIYYSNYSQPQNAPGRPSLQAAQNINGRSSRIILPQTNLNIMPALLDHQVQALLSQGYTRGLTQALHRNAQAFPLRMWIVDNSGSMSRTDGHRLVETKHRNHVQLVTCSRWAEMQQTVDYHAHMAALLEQTTVFRLLNDPGRLNGPQQFGIAERGFSSIAQELEIAKTTMQNTSPEGVTPLADHLREIRANIVDMLPTLRQQGTKVVLVLATDGLPTDAEGWTNDAVRNVQAMKNLKGLPVWIVVRLCTDEDAVVSFWNDLDHQLEMSLEVIDDFCAEGAEVHEHNPWLNYGLSLHRMREMGFHDRLLDLVDERPLSRDEVFDYCRLVLGRDAMDGAPDPQADWEGLLRFINEAQKREKPTWNPVTKKMGPWIDVHRLRRDYSTGILANLRKCCTNVIFNSNSHTKRD